MIIHDAREVLYRTAGGDIVTLFLTAKDRERLSEGDLKLLIAGVDPSTQVGHLKAVIENYRKDVEGWRAECNEAKARALGNARKVDELRSENHRLARKADDLERKVVNPVYVTSYDETTRIKELQGIIDRQAEQIGRDANKIRILDILEGEAMSWRVHKCAPQLLNVEQHRIGDYTNVNGKQVPLYTTIDRAFSLCPVDTAYLERYRDLDEVIAVKDRIIKTHEEHISTLKGLRRYTATAPVVGDTGWRETWGAAGTLKEPGPEPAKITPGAIVWTTVMVFQVLTLIAVLAKSFHP